MWSFRFYVLEKDSLYAAWYTKQYDEFNLEDTNFSWSNNLKDVQVDIYMGTWCGDSKQWVPSFLKMWVN